MTLSGLKKKLVRNWYTHSTNKNIWKKRILVFDQSSPLGLPVLEYKVGGLNMTQDKGGQKFLCLLLDILVRDLQYLLVKSYSGSSKICSCFSHFITKDHTCMEV